MTRQREILVLGLAALGLAATPFVLPLLGGSCCYPILPGLMVAKSVIYFTWAQSKLESEFRRAATERGES